MKKLKAGEIKTAEHSSSTPGSGGIPFAWCRPDAPPFRLSGFPWFARDRVYRRLPLACAGTVRDPVNKLADCTAGGQIAFRSNTRRVSVRVTLAEPPGAMCHMPATGQSGFDLYLGAPGRQRFHRVTTWKLGGVDYEAPLYEQEKAAARVFTINFPLYQGVKAVRLGLEADAWVAPPPPFAPGGRIVIYGTSITQGGCASRPGMAFTNRISRALNCEVVNLGFSGNGQGEPEVVRLVSEVADPRLFVLDYEANSRGREKLGETLPVNIRLLKEKHPEVPVLVVSRIAYARDLAQPETLRERKRSASMQTEIVAALGREGYTGLFFLDGSGFLGAGFDECTVDGIHPSDLGFMRIARALTPQIARLAGLAG